MPKANWETVQTRSLLEVLEEISSTLKSGAGTGGGGTGDVNWDSPTITGTASFDNRPRFGGLVPYDTGNLPTALADALAPYLKSVDAGTTYSTPQSVDEAISDALSSYLTSVNAAATYATPAGVIAAIAAALADYMKTSDAAGQFLKIQGSSTQPQLATLFKAQGPTFFSPQSGNAQYFNAVAAWFESAGGSNLVTISPNLAAPTAQTPSNKQVQAGDAAILNQGSGSLVVGMFGPNLSSIRFGIDNTIKLGIKPTWPGADGVTPVTPIDTGMMDPEDVLHNGDVTQTLCFGGVDTQFRGVCFKTGGVNRWAIGCDTASGNLRIYQYDVNGIWVRNVFELDPTTGAASFSISPVVPTLLGTDVSTKVANMASVKAAIAASGGGSTTGIVAVDDLTGQTAAVIGHQVVASTAKAGLYRISMVAVIKQLGNTGSMTLTASANHSVVQNSDSNIADTQGENISWVFNAYSAAGAPIVVGTSFAFVGGGSQWPNYDLHTRVEYLG